MIEKGVCNPPKSKSRVATKLSNWDIYKRRKGWSAPSKRERSPSRSWNEINNLILFPSFFIFTHVCQFLYLSTLKINETFQRGFPCLFCIHKHDPCVQFNAVTGTLFHFTRSFLKAHEENCKQLEMEMRKMRK